MRADVIHGDCLDVMRGMPDASVDAIVSDPPYGLAFMGKAWDDFGWKDAGVSKPGIGERATAWVSHGDALGGSNPTCATCGGRKRGKVRCACAAPAWRVRGQPLSSGNVAMENFYEFSHAWATEALRVAKPGAHLLAFGGTRTFHRLAVAIEDAGWEIRDCLSWLYGCLDESSEALTRTGWKRGVDLTTADEVLQWDSETGRLSWEHPSAVICKPYSGPMCQIKNRHTDQLLTPNHRVYAKIRRHSRHAAPDRYEVVEARDVSARSAAWQVTLPMAGVYGGTSTGPDASLAYLVGWWLTDAWKHGDGKAVMFSQAKPETLAKLRAALAPFAPSEYVKAAKKLAHNDEHTFYVTGEIAARLRKDFPDRKLTWDVLDWSVQARKGLFDGLMDGDGSQPNKQHTHTFWSKDAERRDVFLALCVSLGMRAYVGEKDCVFVSKKWDTTQVQAKHRPKPIQYEGMVWCVRVPSGAFVARRNGRPFITGNSGFPKSLDVSKAMDKAAGAQRRVVGVNPNFRDPEKNAEHHAKWNAMSGSGDLTEAATDLAKQWEGWGTALKPAWEPVIVARKPLVGTVARNVETFGTGALNVDGCRIEASGRPARESKSGPSVNAFGDGLSGSRAVGTTDLGRWPANVVLDEGAARALDEQTGDLGKSSGTQRTTSASWLGSRTKSEDKAIGFGDSGGASRFFYVAKASRSERNAGLEGFPEALPVAANGSPNAVGVTRGSLSKPRANHHPTVKPVAVMRWLVRLVTPPGGLVLDPFCGSGTTGVAAVREGFRFVGIEREAEYVEIARARVAHAAQGQVSPPGTEAA